MNFNNNIIPLIDIIGLIQGFVLGSLLLFINKKKQKSTIFLGFFILIFSYGFLPFIIKDLNITENYPNLILLPRISEWVLAPLFLIYIHKVSIFSNKKTPYWTLYPGLFFFFFQMSFIITPIRLKIWVMESSWYKLLFLIGLLYSIGILIYALFFIKKHIYEVKNQFSLTSYKLLNWTRCFIYAGFTLITLHIIVFFTEGTIYFKIFFSLANVIMVYWISIYGVLQHNIKSVIPIPTNNNKLLESKPETLDKDIILPNSDKNLIKLVNNINDYMNTSEVFIHQELSIVDIAEALKVHPRRISSAINKICNKNFNSYVNEYRIKKAEKLLNEKEKENLSIEGIGLEVGFHSKSAFYSAFKKFTGTTPLKYKNEIIY